jgi:hypothetical protein
VRGRADRLQVSRHDPRASAPLERRVNGREQVRLGERLRDVVGGAELHGRHRRQDRPDGGHHDDRHVWLEASELLEDLDPVDVGHEDVEQHEVDAPLPDQAEGRPSVRDVQDRVAVVEDQMERFTHPVVVVDDEDDRARRLVEDRGDGFRARSCHGAQSG